MGIQENKQLITSFFEAISAGDLERAFDLVSPSAIWWVPGKTPFSGAHTKAEFARLVALAQSRVDGQWPQWPTRMIAEGDRVAVEAESRARTKTGKEYHNYYHFLFEIRERKIQFCKEYLDTAPIEDVLFG